MFPRRTLYGTAGSIPAAEGGERVSPPASQDKRWAGRMSTINGTINNGIEFGIDYLSPLTITSSGYVNAGTSGLNGAAVYAAAAASLYLLNQGRIKGTGTVVGVDDGATNGFSINNTGTITAGANGIFLAHSGPVTNSGTIISTGSYGIRESSVALQITNTGTGLISGYSAGIRGLSGTISNSGTITATGTASDAIKLNATGAAGASTVSNTGTIVGYVGIGFGGTVTQTVIDSGTIVGSGGTAVAFAAGDDTLIFNPGTLRIQGTVDGGGGTNTLEFASAGIAGTLTGVGADFVNFTKGTVDIGAYWVLAGTNTIGSGTTLTNAGFLADTGTLSNLGSLTIARTGELYVRGGRLVNGATGTTTAYIAGYIYGMQVTTATVVNYATINGGRSGGAGLHQSATLVNEASGSIFGATNGIVIRDSTALVTNLGTITATTGRSSGIFSDAGGSVTNGQSGSAGGTITGYAGIYVRVGTSNIVNFGTISGTAFVGVDLLGGGTIIDGGKIVGGNGPAVNLAGGNSLLKLYPGAALTGIATATGTGNVLELASSASAGTISAIGTSFKGFGAIAVDSGAQWTIIGANTIGSSTTLTNSGTLIDTGPLINSGRLIGNGNLIIDPTTFTNTGYVGLTVTLAGAGDVLDNTSTGTIKVAGNAVYGNASITVLNAGTINATSGVGVNDSAGLSLNNSGLI